MRCDQSLVHLHAGPAQKSFLGIIDIPSCCDVSYLARLSIAILVLAGTLEKD